MPSGTIMIRDKGRSEELNRCKTQHMRILLAFVPTKAWQSISHLLEGKSAFGQGSKYNTRKKRETRERNCPLHTHTFTIHTHKQPKAQTNKYTNPVSKEAKEERGKLEKKKKKKKEKKVQAIKRALASSKP